MGLSSQQVLTFIPSDTWTPVFIIPGNKPNNDGTYLISTSEKYLKRCKDMYEMVLHSYEFKKVCTYQFMGLVAVVIDGLWFRGKMLSYNEFLTKDTVIELIDSGSIFNTQLCDLYQLPDKYKYDPLCLMIKPVTEIPALKLGQFYVQPLLLQSELQTSCVVVNTKPIEIIDSELHSETNFGEVYMSNPSVAINKKDICEKLENMNGTSVIQNLDESNNLAEELKDQDIECEYAMELKEALRKQDMIYIKTISDNLNSIGSNNICTYLSNNEPEHSFMPTVIDNTYKVNDVESSNISSILINDSKIDDIKTAEDHTFKNGSTVEFCYGTNIDFVYIRRYEQKKQYENEMKQFYDYYKINVNKKVHQNLKYGDMVAALLINYKEIHRAVILKSNQQNYGHFLCYFIDIGCKEYVKSNNIFHLKGTKNVPHLAHKVGLKYNPLNNTLLLKFVKEYFDEIYLQPLIIEFDKFDDPIKFNKVILKRQSNNMNIYDEINDFLQNHIPNSMYPQTARESLRNFLSYENLFKNGSIVVINHFYSTKKIYVQIKTPGLTEYYDRLTFDVHQYYDSIKKKNLSLSLKKNPIVGDRVVGRSPSRNKFLRAHISEQINKTTFRVHYIDYGAEECISLNNMFVLPISFRMIPRKVFKIGLKCIIHTSKIKKLTSYFNHLVKSSVPFIAEFDEDDPLGFLNVILKDVSNGANILDKVI